MDLHLYLHIEVATSVTDAITDGIALLSQALAQEGRRMSEALDNLTAEVHATTGVMQSALVLIQGLAQRLADAGTDVVKLDALRADLAENETALAAAVVANQTPAPEPTP